MSTSPAPPRQSPLRHVVVNGWFLGKQATGSGQYLHHLLQALPAHAASLAPAGGISAPTRWTVLTPAAPEIAGLAASWPHVVVAPLPLPRLPGPLRKLWWEQVAVPHWARRLRADVLWVPYWAPPLCKPVPTVVTVHDLIPLLLPGYREGAAQALYNRLVSTATRGATVITVSHAAARDIVTHLHTPAQQVHVVHHGPNQAPELQPEGEPTGGAPIAPAQLAAVAARHQLPARFFLYLGGFDARKNLRTILAAYKRFLELGGDPAVKLVIAGRLPEIDSPLHPDPRALAAQLGITEQVRFLGWVDEAEKPALYALSLGFLFPSLYEGFGMMVLEAQQAGAPVVTSA